MQEVLPDGKIGNIEAIITCMINPLIVYCWSTSSSGTVCSIAKVDLQSKEFFTRAAYAGASQATQLDSGSGGNDRPSASFSL